MMQLKLRRLTVKMTRAKSILALTVIFIFAIMIAYGCSKQTPPSTPTTTQGAESNQPPATTTTTQAMQEQVPNTQTQAIQQEITTDSDTNSIREGETDSDLDNLSGFADTI